MTLKIVISAYLAMVAIVVICVHLNWRYGNGVYESWDGAIGLMLAEGRISEAEAERRLAEMYEHWRRRDLVRVLYQVHKRERQK